MELPVFRFLPVVHCSTVAHQKRKGDYISKPAVCSEQVQNVQKLMHV